MMNDGAELYNSSSHLMAGLKMVDHSGVDPLTDKPLSTSILEDAVQAVLYDCKSLKYNAILKMFSEKDMADACHELCDDVWTFVKKLKTEGLAKSKYGEALKPFCVYLPQDPKSI